MIGGHCVPETFLFLPETNNRASEEYGRETEWSGNPRTGSRAHALMVHCSGFLFLIMGLL